ncbi:Uncharacterized protein dnm_062830 [Desulfonema magnum]|uniref:Uncharacterized protein n=1 Tax=Desulfonema magnum TaxID=45655 RepID=A0A975GQN4_9BACT|nr:Uncharacterized protein dnm_062830 [Desulfonema magnum]
MHQAKNAGRLPDGVCNPVRNVCGRRSGKYSGRGCKPRPAKSELIKTVGCNLSLMHMGRNPAFLGREVPVREKNPGFLCSPAHSPETFRSADNSIRKKIAHIQWPRS